MGLREVNTWACYLMADSKLVYFALFDSQRTCTQMWCVNNLEDTRKFIRPRQDKNRIKTPAFCTTRRGQKTSRKFLRFVKNREINFICSYEASKSHYQKSCTYPKKYYDSKVSTCQMWSKFLEENPDLKTTN